MALAETAVLATQKAKRAFAPQPVSTQKIGQIVNLPEDQVQRVLDLLAMGKTVPFIGRYRKDANGGLGAEKLIAIGRAWQSLHDFEQRRTTILNALAEHKALTPKLATLIQDAPTRADLEDIYLPHRPKRRGPATLASERGLLPLAQRILLQPTLADPNAEANAFVDDKKGVVDATQALAGACDIVAENISQMPNVRRWLREAIVNEGILCVQVSPKGPANKRAKFAQYADGRHRIATVSSHTFLTLRRGERDNALRLHVEVDETAFHQQVMQLMGAQKESPFFAALAQATRDALTHLLLPTLIADARTSLKVQADDEAIEAFGNNLRDILMAPPLGPRPIISIDPNTRTSAHCVAVDAHGQCIKDMTLVVDPKDASNTTSDASLAEFIKAFEPACIVMGTGAGRRDIEAFVRRVLSPTAQGQGCVALQIVPVSDAGAGAYALSELGRQEFAGLNPALCVAVIIAKRLQDPLREWLKVDPKTIGVGQHQHDVNQPKLDKKLKDTAIACVHEVGVWLNDACHFTLQHAGGMGWDQAQRIISLRRARGAFATRQSLQSVAALDAHAFEQIAGFVQIADGQEPLDALRVHPEAYGVVAKMAEDLGVSASALIGDPTITQKIDVSRYVDDTWGEKSIDDIVSELAQPSQDPRRRFFPHSFLPGVTHVDKLKPGMQIEGIVKRITEFGVFVNIGVHQDGLVHVSQLSDRFVSDPTEVAKVGSILRVWVLEIDKERKRISLSARGPHPSRVASRESTAVAQSDAKVPFGHAQRPRPRQNNGGSKDGRSGQAFNNPFAALKKRLPSG